MAWAGISLRGAGTRAAEGGEEPAQMLEIVAFGRRFQVLLVHLGCNNK